MSEKFNAAFWKWFGDSKVVDKNGEPLVVYHGTPYEFNEFRKDASATQRPAFSFTTDKKMAKEFSESLYDPREDDPMPGVVISAYLRAENPFDPRSDRDVKRLIKELKRQRIDQYDEGRISSGVYYILEDLSDVIKLLGYDAYYDREHSKSGLWNINVFDSRQIKSLENDGTWDADDPDIRSNPIEIYSDDEDLKDWGSDEWDARQEKRIAESKRRIMSAAGDYAIVEFSRKDGHKLYLHQTSNSGPNAWQVSFVAPDGFATMDTIFKTRERALASIAGADISPNIGQPGEWKVTAKRNVRGAVK